MRVLQAGLNTGAPVLVYDKTKTYVSGRAAQKTIGGALVIGPPPTGFINSQVDSGLAPQASITTLNGRQFQLATLTGGIATVLLYSVDLTGVTAPSYVGKLQIRVPNAAATTQTLKGFAIYDGASSGAVTGWQIYIGTTGSVLINGGLFIANNISSSDFVPGSPATIEMAVASNAKAVYMPQDPSAIGVANNLTSMQGLSLDVATRRLYFNNNVLATTQFAVFDPSATPNMALQTTTSPTVAASPTLMLTAHGYVNNDPVVITANAPTGFTASNAAAAQSVYFVRNATANTFELSATSGGGSISATSVTSATVVTRAFGQSVSQWLSIRTGTISGMVGTILTTNSQKIVTPSQTTDPFIPAVVNNQNCLFLPTLTNFYLFKVSDITNGATTLPSLVTVNNQGNGSDYTAIATQYATYSVTTGRVIFISNTAQFYVKRWISNVIDSAFGGLTTTYLETPGFSPSTFAGVTAGGLEVTSGILYLVLTTIGQRGVLYSDFRSDSSYGFSFVTSQVLDTSDVQSGSYIATVEKLFDITSSMIFSYKTKSTLGDAGFNDPTTGWTIISTASDLSLVAFNNFTQFRVDYTVDSGVTNTPSQIADLFLSYNGKTEVSDYWAFDEDNTTVGTGSPSYVTLIQKKAYAVSIPTLYLRGFDVSGTQTVGTLNTVANVGIVSNSTNGGTSFGAGVGPNAVGNLVRFLIASPPGSRAYLSLRES